MPVVPSTTVWHRVVYSPVAVFTMYKSQRPPGASVGGPHAYQYLFRRFKSHRVHARTLGAFPCIEKKNDCRKARERELSTFDEH